MRKRLSGNPPIPLLVSIRPDCRLLAPLLSNSKDLSASADEVITHVPRLVAHREDFIDQAWVQDLGFAQQSEAVVAMTSDDETKDVEEEPIDPEAFAAQCYCPCRSIKRPGRREHCCTDSNIARAFHLLVPGRYI